MRLHGSRCTQQVQAPLALEIPVIRAITPFMVPICSMVLEYLSTFTPFLSPSFVDKYTIHGAYGVFVKSHIEINRFFSDNHGHNCMVISYNDPGVNASSKCFRRRSICFRWPTTRRQPPSSLVEITALAGPTWWLIPLSKWVITPVISGLTLLIPFITGVITHLLSGMSHQVIMKDGEK